MTISEVDPSCSVRIFDIQNMEEINGKSKLPANKSIRRYLQFLIIIYFVYCHARRR